ncbi:MAG: alpha/beta fold hydrolase [Pseudomonadota bacterium]
MLTDAFKPGFAQHRISAPDGHSLVVRFFAPGGPARAAVLVVGAMGTTQSYYAPFAAWLAREGFLAATFDYRGVGLSRTGTLRGFQASILDWARLDCAALIDALSARAPDKPLYWIGHSLGGQILPFVPNRERVSKIITVAAGSGYWRENAPPLRRVAWWLWFVLAPLSVRIAGYFPGRRLRKVGNLPRGVMEQWRRWCLHPEYAAGAEGEEARARYESVRMPVVSLSFTDDEYMSARNIDSLHAQYTQAPVTLKRIAPEDVSVKRIGHFGFFRPEHEAALWRAHLLTELC